MSSSYNSLVYGIDVTLTLRRALPQFFSDYKPPDYNLNCYTTQTYMYYTTLRFTAVFAPVSKRDWFFITKLPDWLKKLALFFHPIRINPKPIASHHHSFSRALRQRQVISSSFDWFTGLSMPFVIGQSDDFGFGLRHSIENCSNTQSELYFVQNQCDNHDSQLAIWQKLTFRVSLGIIQLSFEHVGFTCRVRTQFRTKIQDVFHTFSKALFYFKVTGQITPTTTMHWERTVTTIQCGRTRDSKKGTNNKTRPSFPIFPFTLSLFFNNFFTLQIFTLFLPTSNSMNPAYSCQLHEVPTKDQRK